MRHKALILITGLVSMVFAAMHVQAQDLPRDDPEAYYYSVDYGALTDEEKALWGKLGWDEASWSSNDPSAYPETEWSKWDGLSPEQQDALQTLGYNKKSWDESRPRSGVEIIEAFWNSLDWDELSPAEQNLWGVLGWDAKSWSGAAAEPASEQKWWADLSDAERFAATKLGYNEEIWNSN